MGHGHMNDFYLTRGEHTMHTGKVCIFAMNLLQTFSLDCLSLPGGLVYNLIPQVPTEACTYLK